MSISSAFIERPTATSLLMAWILLVGAAAYPLIPVAPLPQVDFPTILVTTQLPGASPEIMASSVTQPLERQFGQIPGVTQMTSSSALGNSAITVQFDLARNIDGAAQDIQTAINAASGQLPKNLPSPPTYRKVNPADAPILVLALTSDTVPLTESPNRHRQTMRWFLLQSYYPPFTTHGPSRRLPLLVLALEGATSYGASAVANPPGHMSRRGASSTGNGTVAPGGSARLASLRQSNQAPRGTRNGNFVAASNRWSASDAPAERADARSVKQPVWLQAQTRPRGARR